MSDRNVTTWSRFIALIVVSATLFSRFALAEPTLEELVAEEARLKESYAELSKANYSVQSLVQRLQSTDDPEQKKAHLEDWQGKVRGFQGQYDAFNEGKLDYLANRYLSLARDIMRDVETSEAYTAAQKESLRHQMKWMESQSKRYMENKGHLGRPQDRQRTLGVNNLLIAMEKFAVDAGKPNRSWSQGASLTGQKLFERVRFLSGVGGLITGLPLTAVQLARGKTVMQASAPAFNLSLWAQGKYMSVQGKEHLGPVAPGTVRIIPMTHYHNVNDFAAISAIAGDKTAVVTALKPPARLPLVKDGLRNWFDGRVEFIPVGEGGRPQDLIKERVEKGQIDSIIIFPEAAMGGFGYELRPAQDSMGTLFKLMERTGMKLEVVPVGLPRAAQLTDKIRQSSHSIDSSKLPVVVTEPIPADVASFLLRSGDRAMLGDVIRQRWMEAYAADKFQDRFMGMPPVQRLVDAMDSQVSGNTGCEGWMARAKAPTALPGPTVSLLKASGD